jgi:hypothetical protein
MTGISPGPIFCLGILPAKLRDLGVDPTRLELVTSAMRTQREEFVSVRLRSKTAANKHILPKVLSSVFAVVHLGWCQVGVNSDQAPPRT